MYQDQEDTNPYFSSRNHLRFSQGRTPEYSNIKDDVEEEFVMPKLFCKIPRVVPNQREKFFRDDLYVRNGKKYQEVRNQRSKHA